MTRNAEGFPKRRKPRVRWLQSYGKYTPVLGQMYEDEDLVSIQVSAVLNRMLSGESKGLRRLR